MPGFVTHYLFGVDAYASMDNTKLKQNLRHNRGAYALGLQGPDLFFYYLPSYFFHTQNLGDLAHRKSTGAFFSYLLESRTLFAKKPHMTAIADAYILGFIGHYTLDSIAHPYVYAFTNFDPENPPKNSHYFGQHAYFETELDNELLYRKKHINPSKFHQNATIHLTPLQRSVISKMLTYAYRNTYPSENVYRFQVSGATKWMKLGTGILRDPSGQKKVLARLIEKVLFNRPFISAMFPSDNYHFVEDPMNLAHKKWVNPWTNEESTKTFRDLYKQASDLFNMRIVNYSKMINNGFTIEERRAFTTEYGNKSFLSGLKSL